MRQTLLNMGVLQLVITSLSFLTLQVKHPQTQTQSGSICLQRFELAGKMYNLD